MNLQEKKRSKLSELSFRFLINGASALLILFFIFFAYLTPVRWIFFAAVATLSALAVWEYDHLLKKKNIAPALLLSIIAVILYILAVFCKTEFPHFLGVWGESSPEIILALTFFSSFAFYSVTYSGAIVGIATTFFGVLYVGIPLGLILRILFEYPFEGSWWLLYLIAVTKSADMGGYFVGRYFGKRRLAAHLSPKKTLEGAIGGLLASVAIGLAITFLGKDEGAFRHFSYLAALILSIVVAIFGQLGDLAESLLKRDARVKDSNSLPGVGGILDMIDSLLFTSPIVYIFLKVQYY